MSIIFHNIDSTVSLVKLSNVRIFLKNSKNQVPFNVDCSLLSSIHNVNQFLNLKELTFTVSIPKYSTCRIAESAERKFPEIRISQHS